MDAPTDSAFERFIRRRHDADGTERADYQLSSPSCSTGNDRCRRHKDSEDNA